MNMQKQHMMHPRKCQRGAVAIIVGICIFVLVGMIGLVVDMGHLFVYKTELQNAADSCALAAAKELDGAADAILRAENAGITVGQQNKANLQEATVTILPANVKFSATLSPNSNYLSQASGANPATAQYAMCTLNRNDIPMWFMQVMGLGDQAVAAEAVATLAPSQTACAIPIGVCSQGAAPTFGLVTGKWYSGKFSAGSGGTGSYNWIDFSPPSGGANELKDLLAGVGECNLPPVGTPVGEQGQVVGLTDAWNSRFGTYKNGGAYNATTAAPDFTGLAYTTATWPHANPATPENAYSGTPDSGSTSNYLAAEAARSSYQSTDPAGIGLPPFRVSTVATHTQFGANRRIVSAPIVDCTALTSPTQQVPVLGYACVLMLNPINGPTDVILEARGLANSPSSPCASFGLPGGTVGPLVPVLVQ
jgi:Flp pilus assembly protein TadG